jgi:hypothetical protein
VNVNAIRWVYLHAEAHSAYALVYLPWQEADVLCGASGNMVLCDGARLLVAMTPAARGALQDHRSVNTPTHVPNEAVTVERLMNVRPLNRMLGRFGRQAFVTAYGEFFW